MTGHQPARVIVFLVSALAIACVSQAQDGTQAGQASSIHPTYENLSITWPIEGDENSNGQVSVRFRKYGEKAWQKGLQLSRVPAGANCSFEWLNRHAGSIFGLSPGTQYEIELSLTDPDGGDTSQTIHTETRAWPVSGKKGILVTPETIARAIDELKPGQVLIMEDGTYRDLDIRTNGISDQPIVIRAKHDSQAIVNGEVLAMNREHVHFIGLKVNGKIKFNNGKFIVVRDCDIVTERDGIVAYGEQTSNNTIIGNRVLGPTQWSEKAIGAKGANLGEGIVMTGPGHVIARNRVEGFRDGISLVEDGGAFDQRSVDIYRNDIYRCGDDGIEADFAMGNVRVYENRLTDCFMGISSQPSLGGPTYFIRNVMYNPLIQAFKLQRASVGDLGFHNTVVKAGDAFNVNTEAVLSRAQFFNNLFIGGNSAKFNGYRSGEQRVVYLPSADSKCQFGFNGFGVTGSNLFYGQIGELRFNSLEELVEAAGHPGSIKIDLSVFQTPMLNLESPMSKHEPADFSLSENCVAIDHAKLFPNINDRFTGDGPDLGAIELGSEAVIYGPVR